jgi:hypothetical protein
MILDYDDELFILLGILIISMLTTFVAFQELPNEDVEKLKANSSVEPAVSE